METATEVQPHSVNRTELRPLGLKGRAWIATDSGQVMHIETNLTEGILMIDLQEISISVDYAPVTSQSQNGDIWLPKHVVAYTDYANRRFAFSCWAQPQNHQPKNTLPLRKTL